MHKGTIKVQWQKGVGHQNICDSYGKDIPRRYALSG